MAAVLLIGILIGTVAFVFSINYARRARTMVEGGSEEAWAEAKEHAPLIRGKFRCCSGKEGVSVHNLTSWRPCVSYRPCGQLGVG